MPQEFTDRSRATTIMSEDPENPERKRNAEASEEPENPERKEKAEASERPENTERKEKAEAIEEPENPERKRKAEGFDGYWPQTRKILEPKKWAIVEAVHKADDHERKKKRTKNWNEQEFEENKKIRWAKARKEMEELDKNEPARATETEPRSSEPSEKNSTGDSIMSMLRNIQGNMEKLSKKFDTHEDEIKEMAIARYIDDNLDYVNEHAIQSYRGILIVDRTPTPNIFKIWIWPKITKLPPFVFF